MLLRQHCLRRAACVTSSVGQARSRRSGNAAPRRDPAGRLRPGRLGPLYPSERAFEASERARVKSNIQILNCKLAKPNLEPAE